MPEDVMQTFPAGSIPEDQLVALRKKHNFEVHEGLGRREAFAILEEVTC